jgi:hypothetical protein
VHAYNYSDLPLRDLVFGTFRNPAHCEAAGGFYDGASQRLLDMLIGRDVATPVAGEHGGRLAGYRITASRGHSRERTGNVPTRAR